MERDERIMEVERLLDCMGKVKEVHVRLGDVCAAGKSKCLSTDAFRCLFLPGEGSTPEEVAGKRAAPPSAGADRHNRWHRSKKVG